MPNESKVFDLTISSEKNDLQYIPAIIPEACQEWAKDVELKGSSTILFTMKGNNQCDDESESRYSY